MPFFLHACMHARSGGYATVVKKLKPVLIEPEMYRALSALIALIALNLYKSQYTSSLRPHTLVAQGTCTEDKGRCGGGRSRPHTK